MLGSHRDSFISSLTDRSARTPTVRKKRGEGKKGKGGGRRGGEKMRPRMCELPSPLTTRQTTLYVVRFESGRKRGKKKRERKNISLSISAFGSLRKKGEKEKREKEGEKEEKKKKGGRRTRKERMRRRRERQQAIKLSYITFISKKGGEERGEEGKGEKKKEREMIRGASQSRHLYPLNLT